MNRFTVILKSGKEFSFDALEMDVTYNKISGAAERLSWKGARSTHPLYIQPAEVAAIYYNKLDENNGGDTVT